MPRDQALIVFGETEIAEGIIVCNTHASIDGRASARVVLSNEALVRAGVDYLADVRIYIVREAERHILFTGIVDAVAPGERETEVFLTSTHMTRLGETRSGGLGAERVDHREAVWSVMRLSGIPESVIEIEGFRPGPPEVFEVAVPLDGISVNRPFSIGEVHIVPRGAVARLADGIDLDDLWERYAGASAWALTLQTAFTLFDAEAKGLRAIDLTLTWLMARARYSGPALPGRGPRRFRRAWVASRVTRSDVVVVNGATTGRRWLRSMSITTDRPVMDIDELEDLEAMPLPPGLPVELREALAAWRRAVEATDPFATVVALWEAVEFYAAGAKVSKTFSKSELKAIRAAAIQGLQGEKRQRVEQVLEMLNAPSLMLRLRSALNEDRVPVTEEEFALLRRVRTTRNDLEHGGAATIPAEGDVKQATALVNRMLTYRLSRLTAPSRALRSSQEISPDLIKGLADAPP